MDIESELTRLIATKHQVTGVDIFVSDGEDEDEAEADESTEEYFIKKRWNLNAPFRQDKRPQHLRPESFHLINSRLLAEGINRDRWSPYVGELKKLLEPGGWLQMLELRMLFQSNNNSIPDDSPLRRWSEWYDVAMSRMNKESRIGSRLHALMAEHDFEAVRSEIFDLPIGTWKQDAVEIGASMLHLMNGLLESYSLWTFLRVAGMDPQQYADLISGARTQLADPSLKLYING
ncbi:hypothetical protein MBLNU230_g3233t2 [Neophaeotheca triangularis]